ncbi:hypothetical protein CERSUDRAFT_75782 [Gelatoporia subvermispora B]|uniref:Uncharacterized protein n=1 Tax=Ceriporiopsis subvermispora (strain B) TaxID=914234 RepID=M2PE94_CERS8|nr:hypothetical protein CERSUDRAFT_75782 [Gelatoporia subvermispora B]
MSTALDSCNTSRGRPETNDRGEYKIHRMGHYGLNREEEYEVDEREENGPEKFNGCTCKTLCDIMNDTIEKRPHMSSLDDILSDQTRGYFLTNVSMINALVAPPDTIGTVSAQAPFRSCRRYACTINVIINDSQRYNLGGVYFGRDLRFKKRKSKPCVIDMTSAIEIWNCPSDGYHLIWDLGSATSLSDSLEEIDTRFDARDPEKVLHQSSTAAAALLSTSTTGATIPRLV